jgi:arsenite methyltransferase
MEPRPVSTFENTPEFADVYDELPLWSAPFGLLLLRHLDCAKGLTVLDLGSGTGFPILEIAQRFGHTGTYYSLDTWSCANQRTRKKAEYYHIRGLTVLDGSAAQIPLPDGSVDRIVSNLGLNNFADLAQVLAECRRVLKTGGRVSIATNLNGHWKEFYAVFEQTLVESGRADLVPALTAQQEKRGTVAQISRVFQDAGFRLSKAVEERFEMVFADGTAFMEHHFVQMGWFPGWQEVVGGSDAPGIFEQLENNLNVHASQCGGLRLTVPMGYLEFEK